MANLKLRDWIECFKIGKFDSANIRTQIKAGWERWDCNKTCLPSVTKELGAIIIQINDGGKINLDNVYVYFKNEQPFYGPCYDSFSFADYNSGMTMMIVKIKSSRNGRRYEVFAKQDAFDKKIPKQVFKTNFIQDLVVWLNTPWEVK